MSKYDDRTYQSYSENQKQALPKTDPVNIEDFPEVFKNMPISEIKKLMYLKKGEKFCFNFMNNKQEFVTKEYLDNCRMFDQLFSKDAKYNFVFDFMKDAYGVMTPSMLKDCFEKSFGILDKEIPEETYAEIIQHHFGKKQIDLNNENDRAKLKEVLKKSEEVVLDDNELPNENKNKDAYNYHNESQLRNSELVFPSANQDDIKSKNAQESNFKNKENSNKPNRILEPDF